MDLGRIAAVAASFSIGLWKVQNAAAKSSVAQAIPAIFVHPLYGEAVRPLE